MDRDLDALGLALLPASAMAAALLVPDVTVPGILHPTMVAVGAGALLLSLVVVQRGRGRRGSRLERTSFALFLGGMPTVYILSGLAGGGLHGDWLATELAGQAIFAAVALYGATRQPFAIGAGILAHGLAWDAWHHGRAPFMPDWYPAACAVFDVGYGTYALTQARAWARSRHSWWSASGA